MSGFLSQFIGDNGGWLDWIVYKIISIILVLFVISFSIHLILKRIFFG